MASTTCFDIISKFFFDRLPRKFFVMAIITRFVFVVMQVTVIVIVTYGTKVTERLFIYLEHVNDPPAIWWFVGGGRLPQLTTRWCQRVVRTRLFIFFQKISRPVSYQTPPLIMIIHTLGFQCCGGSQRSITKRKAYINELIPRQYF